MLDLIQQQFLRLVHIAGGGVGPGQGNGALIRVLPGVGLFIQRHGLVIVALVHVCLSLGHEVFILHRVGVGAKAHHQHDGDDHQQDHPADEQQPLLVVQQFFHFDILHPNDKKTGGMLPPVLIT